MGMVWVGWPLLWWLRILCGASWMGVEVGRGGKIGETERGEEEEEDL